jgi:ketosteroid isomerase-like protein
MTKDVIVSLFDHIDRQAWDGLASLLAADVAYERPGYEPFLGRQRVLEFYREERIICSGAHELQSIVVDGDTAACSGRFRGLLKDGRAADVRFADLYEFEQGVIKKRTSYFFSPSV